MLPLKDKYPVNFSGQWVFNEDKSDLGDWGTGNVPYEMEVDQDDDLLLVKKLMIVEWGDNRITNEEIMLDGTEMKSEFLIHHVFQQRTMIKIINLLLLIPR